MLITTDPTRELSLLQSDLNRMFDRFFGPQGVATEQRWLPPLDIVEQDDHYLLRMDLPGIADEDVSIELEDRVLRISGERRESHERSGNGYRRIERGYGSFERVLTLPDGVEPDGVRASFDRGVLEVVVPKPEERRPRRVAIQSGARAPEQIEGHATESSEGNGSRSLKDRVLSRA